MMAELYDVEISTINKHIKKLYQDSELEEIATIRKFRIVQTEGHPQRAFCFEIAENISPHSLQKTVKTRR